MNITESKICAILFPGENNPRNSEGSFLKLDDGRIAYAFSRYTGDSHSDDAPCNICCIYSSDNGNSWDTKNIETLVSAKEYGQTNVMSVTLRYMDNGDIGLFYMLKIHDSHISYYYLRRYKGNFSAPCKEVRINSDKYPAYYVINNDRVVRHSSGKWIIPAALHDEDRVNEESLSPDLRGTAVFFISDDDGKNWKLEKPRLVLDIPQSNSGLQEPGVVELPGGVLYAYFRTDMMCQYESVSLDKGKSWFAPQPSKFTSPTSPMLIKQNLFSGKYYAVWNPVPQYPGRPKPEGLWMGGRTPLVIAESEDGVNFSAYTALDDDFERGFCYPAIEFLDEKTLLVAYCSGGREDGGCLNRITIRKIIVE